ncbi:hypothetical protein [Sinorhizobium sp. BG8]|nr:hypothetical protein [Sinorhizobium sp. BG8]
MVAATIVSITAITILFIADFAGTIQATKRDREALAVAKREVGGFGV